MAKKFISKKIREAQGQFVPVSDRYMIYSEIERMGKCEACGHPIKNHHGVQSPDGDLLWVGSTCWHTLCSEEAEEIDLEAGATWEDDGREYIIPTAEWIARIAEKTFAPGVVGNGDGMRRSDRAHTRNNFLASIVWQAEGRGQLTLRQYEAANRVAK